MGIKKAPRSATTPASRVYAVIIRCSPLAPAHGYVRVYRFRSGNTVSATQWEEAMADAERWLGDRKVALNRGDLGFGHDAIVAWHEAAPARPKFLFKLKLTARVRSALHRIKESDWQEPATLGACQIAEARIQITG